MSGQVYPRRFCADKRRFLQGVAAACALPITTFARAQARWPSRAVKLVVPFAPGGGADVIARLLAPHFSAQLGQQMLIDNRPGASGLIGAGAVAVAPADGYTLLLSNNASIATGPLVYGNATFHPMNDFAHVLMVGSFANGFLVRADHPAKSLEEFLALARAMPGKLTFASAGPGSAGHLTGELLKTQASIDMQHVPYKGTGPAIVDLMSGQIDAIFDGLPASLGYLRGGKLRVLAISSKQRLPLLAAIPTIDEVVPGVVGSAWFGISAPAQTPREIIRQLQESGQRVLALAAVRNRFAEMGIVVSVIGQQAFSAFVEQEIARWGPVIKRAKIRAE